MALCSGIKADGGRCKAQAISNSTYCLSHDPEQAEARKRRASKGGKRGGRGRPLTELAALRDEIAEIRRRVLKGELSPHVAAVATQTINADFRAVDLMLKAKDAEETEARLEELEEAVEAHKLGRGYYGQS